jgi:organic hydroperoxide reductase OsmC/OhrA
MTKDDAGREWISKVELRPEIEFIGENPSKDRLAELHEKAHHECYIANSIKSSVEIHSE